MPYTRLDLDITRQDRVVEVISSLTPDLVINAAAYTAVDKAECEIEAAYAVNEKGPANLAKTCDRQGIPLFHISTDYVFNGESNHPYSEDDVTDPVSVYGKSKLAGEVAVRVLASKHIILRTAWVFSSDGNNFLKTMLRLAGERDKLTIVGDQFGGPTSANGIANALLTIAKRIQNSKDECWGVYHFTGSPYVNWFQFASNIFEQSVQLKLLTKAPRLIAVTSEEFATPVKRPKNSRLDCSKIEAVFDVKSEDWQVGVEQVLKELSQINKAQ
ncbi:dTDP-4-dehydrorhamnose reductase [Marinobacterium sp. xm-m-312]|nr:dTDP-4-dehydrorhamnose reductase [Marinobacterium sp. xm-d-543]NRQ22338.1 dTDP-4-dehydrorhamnose reductase [Marinobacterium sp. xm-m-312]